ncbi:branched-chain amino acid ABC transporter permease [Bordetella pseudohinzii]|uniref:ABC transporter permease n=1 Tax=Bordetella pseudohinzii TaxID=1331258 RepID=A0A0J6EZF5_9BORD|nr:branched-chain amino acid ABC transporter permease [Bordetella pseudohinzii]ANY17467.1 ABC transporter permease [Bordetella pseudohinzii]KMM25690.1 ABC transporter permease [Bordetella pseudohinzii]KXA81683.1 ABC transporter permease [Bordetella pseudohinzii]KXA83078.1 ABC transporter permease [Bordetella pseudohinzii]CUI71763.1 LIV-I protein H [Bordetella pseudohinzii]
MNAQIALILGQDGITNGAIYALLALAILLVFAVTRVLFIPQGEFVAFGALTMAAIQDGKPVALVWLVVAFALIEAAVDLRAQYRRRGRLFWQWRLAAKAVYPLAVAALFYTLPLAALPAGAQALLTLALLVPLGPQLYRLFYQPIASASTLVLLIVSIAVHLALVGLGLLAFGAEGARTRPFIDASFALGPVNINGQAIWVVAASAVLIVALYLFFERSMYGKALRAAAFNRLGARLMGISPVFAGKITFFVAALIGTVSGILIAPITTLYFDSGFLVSLKGFVGAIIGGLVSYPLAAAGALLVGLIEAFSAFWASAYKEIIVFTLIIPVLLWRSLKSHTVEEEEDEA